MLPPNLIHSYRPADNQSRSSRSLSTIVPGSKVLESTDFGIRDREAAVVIGEITPSFDLTGPLAFKALRVGVLDEQESYEDLRGIPRGARVNADLAQRREQLPLD